MSDTKAKLLAATVQSLREDGIAGLSARGIAARAEVNQALVFYHFKTVPALVDAAVRASVDDAVEYYRDEFAAAGSLRQLLRIGRELHGREKAAGNVAMVAQLLAGAQQDEALAATARYALDRWHRQLEPTVRRLLRDSPLALIADPAGLARAISAGFLGLELYDGVDADGARHALDALEQLGVLVEVVDELGPVARRAVRSTLRRANSRGLKHSRA